MAEVRLIAATAVKVEGTPGTWDAPAASDCFWTYDSKLPYDPEFRSNSLENDSGAYTGGKDIPGPYIAHPVVNVSLMGSGGAANAPAKWAAILRAIGLVQTINGSTDVNYKVPASALTAATPISVVSDIDGQQFQSFGVIGQSARLTAEAVGRSTIQFRGIGKARGAKLTGDTGYIDLSTPAPGTDSSKQFLSNSLSTITPSGRAAIAPVGFGLDLDFGLQIAEVTSFNAGATLGLYAVYTVRIRPKLTLRLAVDKATGAGNTLKLSQIEADIAAQNVWAIHMELGGQTTGTFVQLDVPTGQPTGYTLQRAPGGEILGYNVNINVQHASPGSEIVVTTK